MDIKKIVSYYKRKTGTTDPFDIADQLGILYQICNLQFEGCYMFLKNHRYIFINENLPEYEQRLVMAHELGHAILHRKENCYFIRNRTLLLNSKRKLKLIGSLWNYYYQIRYWKNTEILLLNKYPESQDIIKI